MKYNFDEIIDRNGTCAEKYTELKSGFGRADAIPLWVADMDFKVAQPIIDALKERVDHGIFGYTVRTDSCYDAVCDFQKRRKNWIIDKNLISFSAGVAPSVFMIIRELTEPDAAIIIQTPVYRPFHNAVKYAGRQLMESPLIEVNGHFFMDYDDLEEKAKRGAKYMILCSPHNPVGRVWTREELERLGDICLRYGIKVISDEIHSDLILWGKKHIPFASISEELQKITITCIAPSKTFNLSGLKSAMAIFPNIETKNKFDSAWEKLHLEANNCLSITAIQAAFQYGEEWLEQVLAYIEDNIKFIMDYFSENISLIKPPLPEGTYLIWLDCRGLSLPVEELNKFMVFEAGLALTPGANFGKNGEGFMRMNVACPKAVLEKALGQFKNAVDNRFHKLP